MPAFNETSAVLHSTALYTSAAQALAAMLPTATSLSAVLHTGPRQDWVASAAGAVLCATFVGEQSADVVLHVAERELGGSSERRTARVGTEDLLRPALEAATGVLGIGVLSLESGENAQGTLSAADTVGFMLRTQSGEDAGFFALRLRETAPVSGPAPSVEEPEDMASRLGRISNVEMALTVQIGRTRLSVRDVLNLEPGAVIELDRSAGAPADVLLNGRLIAQGEVVVMDQDYGVRITKILDMDSAGA
ncbi:flagellar motor switch protein FliN [Glutamicibacter soli]|uniref:flagellar motor switch protein FliN n=1 Tax=Glutamicibacter soli TaxID=453836 RepID=UPI0006B23D04|nr:hypothetical protein AFL94_06720 [Arthrobacter sp. LS16]